MPPPTTFQLPRADDFDATYVNYVVLAWQGFNLLVASANSIV